VDARPDLISLNGRRSSMRDGSSQAPEIMAAALHSMIRFPLGDDQFPAGSGCGGPHKTESE
jgi:hypothetical protein